MAEKVRNFDPPQRAGAPEKYPWDEWLTPKSQWRIQQGEDFHCGPKSMCNRIRVQAKKRKQKVSVYHEPDNDPYSLVIVNR